MAVRNDFSAGETLTAQDLNDTFASKVDYATPTNAQTGTAYTFVADDAERLTTASNGSAVTFTIPPQSSVTWGDDTILRVVNYGAGAVTVDGGSGVTVTNTATTVEQYQAAAAIRTGSDAWTLVPFAGGGEIPAADISSPAATGQYTDGSGDTWDYYTFTASGTLTVDNAGFADLLIIAGGGSSFFDTTYANAGGAGGMLELTDAYLPAGSLTVTVGGGGASGATGGSASGNDSLLDTFVAVGGGGGGGSGGSGLIGCSGGSGSGDTRGALGIGVTNQGNSGGAGGSGTVGAGGGAGSAASGSTPGTGKASSITGSSVTYATGGGSTTSNTANTGNGGGGSGRPSGNSGVVIVRVKV